MRKVSITNVFMLMVGVSSLWYLSMFYAVKFSSRVLKTNIYNCSLLPNHERFEKMISKYAIDRIIVISLTDRSFMEMAQNLYESSFKRFNIDNYLFVCSNEKAEQNLTSRGIHAVTLWNETLSLQGENYPQKEYKTKTNFKTEAVYMALCLGYTVLLVDADIVFLQNPLPYLMQFSETYDLIIQNEYALMNTGFYMAKAHSPAAELHHRMLTARDEMRSGFPRTDQFYMNSVVGKEMKGTIRIKRLDRDLFPWDMHYMTEGNREFAGDNLTEPVIFHCTNSASVGIKRYRFREFLMWHLDYDRYYSCPDRKYLTFELPADMFSKTAQACALSAGFHLASILNRTIILPKFHCEEKNTPEHHCNYYSCLEGKRNFRLDEFEGIYREHMFLHHPLVPHSVEQSQSDIINIRDIVDKQQLDENQTNLLLEALKEFEAYSVIRLYNLHNMTIPETSPFGSRFNPVQLLNLINCD